MASITRQGKGRRTIQFAGPDGRRRSIRLGKVSQRTAEAIKVRVERLATAWISGHPADDETIRWVAALDGLLHGRIAAAGLVAFHSGATAISDLPLTGLCGEGVVADVSDAVTDYGFYTPEMITERVDVREGDILVVHTGYRRYAWDQPDVANDAAQGGIENKEFGYYVRHPGPSPDFFPGRSR